MTSIAIIGSTGVVGQELVQLSSSIEDLTLFDSKSPILFDGIDIAFFCVEATIAKSLIPKARKKNILCIDGSSAYRNDPNVPLIIPEINLESMKSHNGIIASPNCTTTLMLLPLAPLHKHFQIRRIITTTYQAVSGAGIKGIRELEEQTKAYLENRPLEKEVFPYPIAFNLFLHESPEEEIKMREETHKILNDLSIGVSATCVRVPVIRAHSLSINVEFASPFEIDIAKELISRAKGVKFMERGPTPLDATGRKDVYCGRLRKDPTRANTLEMWVVGDQLLKGAALNMFQIAEELLVTHH